MSIERSTEPVVCVGQVVELLARATSALGQGNAEDAASLTDAAAQWCLRGEPISAADGVVLSEAFAQCRTAEAKFRRQLMQELSASGSGARAAAAYDAEGKRP